MPLSSIQILAIIVFISSLSVRFLYDVWKNKKFRLGIVETTLIPIITALIILSFKFDFLFTNNTLLSALGLLFLMGGLMFSFFSAKYLGKNKDDFWIARKKEKKRTLITSGPYSKIRHPLYTSMILYYFGLILVFFHFVTVILYLLLVGIIIFTALAEEKFLREKFSKYNDYLKKTGMFFPRIYSKGHN